MLNESALSFTSHLVPKICLCKIPINAAPKISSCRAAAPGPELRLTRRRIPRRLGPRSRPPRGLSRPTPSAVEVKNGPHSSKVQQPTLAQEEGGQENGGAYGAAQLLECTMTNYGQLLFGLRQLHAAGHQKEGPAVSERYTEPRHYRASFAVAGPNRDCDCSA